ncbi:hypothetical protein AALP_AA1G157000 [Arabis alpina]|uniref:Uncharacterized protein n=1 Tax=Arabis alpina TaxID=50452 RepID=A0A087HNG2_ARAAL|nr:hypothetical protein AALP_AA1G157000 [Arabis alpina]
MSSDLVLSGNSIGSEVLGSCHNEESNIQHLSVAWGTCGDTYNRHKDPLFRELLFVSGNDGVTVHAFCCFKDSSD